MNNKNTAETIFSILERKGGVPGASIDEKLAYRFLDKGHIDSLGIMGFIMEIEEIFDIELSPEDTQSEEFRCIGGLVNLINQKLNG